MVLAICVLGAAAGGGFPQWNANSVACQRARAHDPAARPATQASIAVSADRRTWFLVNASPDLRQQIEANSCLQPKAGTRSTPIGGVILTNADVDAIAGLLHLREQTAFTLYAPARVLAALDGSPIFEVVDRSIVPRRELCEDDWQELCLASGAGSGLRVRPFRVPGKIPLYQETEQADLDPKALEGDCLGLEFQAGGKRFFYVANCARMTPELEARLEGAPLVFFDGTLFDDQEMIDQGVGRKTGARMGHMSLSGPDGSMRALRPLGIGRTIFIHINNTNPILLADSNERKLVEEAGFEVAHDGMEIDL